MCGRRKMILADKIIELRKRNGWSQEELAEKLDVSRQSISKWEGAQSIPDMNRILQMSEIFGVSTDFLLKDEMEFDEDARNAGGELIKTDLNGFDDECEVRRVTMEDAVNFLDIKDRESRLVPIGVMLCILSPIVLIVLEGLAELGTIAMSEDMALGAGLVVLFIMVGAAVGLFIKAGMDGDRYEYIEKEFIDTVYGVDGMVRERKEHFHESYTGMMISGIVLCVISVIPIFITMMLFGDERADDNEIYFIYSVGALLAMVAIGVFLIVHASIIQGGYQMLLEEGDYTRKAKLANKKNGKIAAVYWAVVLAGYLGYSFITEEWERSWIIWPVAAVLYGIVIVVAETLRKNG